MSQVLLISRCTACFYELLVMQIDLSTLILAWNWLHIKRNVRKRVWRIVLIPFMPPTLKIPVNTRLLKSQTEVGEPTNYNTSSGPPSLKLRTTTTKFSLNHKQQSCKQHQHFSFYTVSLIFTGSHCSVLLITTLTVSDPIMSETQP